MANRVSTAQIRSIFLIKRMHLQKEQPAILQVVLRNAVVETCAAAQLQELNWGEFVQYAPTSLVVMRYIGVGVE